MQEMPHFRSGGCYSTMHKVSLIAALVAAVVLFLTAPGCIRDPKVVVQPVFLGRRVAAP